MITFRIIQGAGAAIMFPAALAIVVGSFPVAERGKAMAIFFAITGGLTAVGPIAGGYLVEWDWRAIFWVNIPVAVIALVLTAIAKPAEEKNPSPLDFRGAVLVSAGMGLVVLGLQQSSVWEWADPRTIGCIAGGIVLLIAFVAFELRASNPLIRVRIFANRAFAADNAILFLMSIGFVSLFFFSSTYAQISLGKDASGAGVYLLTFFAGFALASQVGGRILDERGPKGAVVPGCALTAVGFYLWAGDLPDLNFDQQWVYIVMTGAGMGLILSPANTDALNRAASTRYGEVTGITQTVRNFASSLGLAILGSILISQNTSNIEESLGEQGISKSEADKIADAVNHSGGGDSSSFAEHGGAAAQKVFKAIQLDYAESVQTVYYVLAGIMAFAFVVALVMMPQGKAEDDPAPAGDGETTPPARAPAASDPSDST